MKEGGEEARRREEARNCRNFPISHHVIVILPLCRRISRVSTPIPLLWPYESRARHTRPRLSHLPHVIPFHPSRFPIFLHDIYAPIW